jgi:hypothetical protein
MQVAPASNALLATVSLRYKFESVTYICAFTHTIVDNPKSKKAENIYIRFNKNHIVLNIIIFRICCLVSSILRFNDRGIIEQQYCQRGGCAAGALLLPMPAIFAGLKAGSERRECFERCISVESVS